MSAPTNASIQALIAEVGDRIRIIKSTSFIIPLYYRNMAGLPTITLDDLEFVTFGGVDYIKVKKWSPSKQKYYYDYCNTEKVEYITVASDSGDQLEPYQMNL